MKTISRKHSLAMGIIALCQLTSCGPAGSTPEHAQTDAPAPQKQASGTPSDGVNRCALLTDDEVNTAIGPHTPGSNDISNLWGLQSCRWTATTAPKSKAPEGWREAIEVAVFFKERTSWAREQAKGDPVQGVVEGAVYDESSGDLWFNCARDRFCVVKARTASGANREQIAVQLAKTVVNRLR